MTASSLGYNQPIEREAEIATELIGGVHYLKTVASGSAATPTQLNGSNPAAGAEVSQTVPGGERWELKAVSVALVQGLTQTPQPILQIDDGTDVVYESFGASAAQAVSTTCRYTWAPGHTLSGLVGATTNVHAVAPLPFGLVLDAGWRIKTVTLGIGANSDYGAPSFYYVPVLG